MNFRIPQKVGSSLTAKRLPASQEYVRSHTFRGILNPSSSFIHCTCRWRCMLRSLGFVTEGTSLSDRRKIEVQVGAVLPSFTVKSCVTLLGWDAFILSTVT